MPTKVMDSIYEHVSSANEEEEEETLSTYYLPPSRAFQRELNNN